MIKNNFVFIFLQEATFIFPILGTNVQPSYALELSVLEREGCVGILPSSASTQLNFNSN